MYTITIQTPYDLIRIEDNTMQLVDVFKDGLDDFMNDVDTPFFFVKCKNTEVMLSKHILKESLIQIFKQL